MEKIEDEYPNLTKKVKKLLIDPPILLDGLISDGGGASLGCISVIFVIIPSLIICVFLPFVFLGYAIYRNIIYIGEYKTISTWVCVFAIWMFLGIIFQIIARTKKGLKDLKNNKSIGNISGT